MFLAMLLIFSDIKGGMHLLRELLSLGFLGVKKLLN